MFLTEIYISEKDRERKSSTRDKSQEKKNLGTTVLLTGGELLHSRFSAKASKNFSCMTPERFVDGIQIEFYTSICQPLFWLCVVVYVLVAQIAG